MAYVGEIITLLKMVEINPRDYFLEELENIEIIDVEIGLIKLKKVLKEINDNRKKIKELVKQRRNTKNPLKKIFIKRKIKKTRKENYKKYQEYAQIIEKLRTKIKEEKYYENVF